LEPPICRLQEKLAKQIVENAIAVWHRSVHRSGAAASGNEHRLQRHAYVNSAGLFGDRSGIDIRGKAADNDFSVTTTQPGVTHTLPCALISKLLYDSHLGDWVVTFFDPLSAKIALHYGLDINFGSKYIQAMMMFDPVLEVVAGEDANIM